MGLIRGGLGEEPGGAEGAEDLVGRDMVEEDEPVAELARGLQEVERADDVGLDEVVGGIGMSYPNLQPTSARTICL